MSIPELLCYQKVCTLLALSLIRHCSGLSISLNMKILSENKTEALSNTRGIMLHIQLSELSLRYMSKSLQLPETDDHKSPGSSPTPKVLPKTMQPAFYQTPLFCSATANVASSLYSPWRVDVDDILWPALQVSCCLSRKENFEYWFSCIDDSILRWKRSRRLFQLLADGNLYCTLLKHF